MFESAGIQRLPTVSMMADRTGSCLLECFGQSWSKPAGRLDNGRYPPFNSVSVLAGKDWQDVDRSEFRKEWSMLVELNPGWFVYYTPMVLLSALEEAALPTYHWYCGWMELFVPGSMFDGAFSAEDSPRLDNDKETCLYCVAEALEAAGYVDPSVMEGNSFALNLHNFIHSVGSTDCH